MSLAAMVTKFWQWKIETGKDYGLSIMTANKGFQLDRMRNQVVQMALKADADYLLFLDGDQITKANAIPLFLEDFEDNPEIECITGLYHSQSPPYLPHIFYKKKNGHFAKWAKFPLNRLFEVEGAGAGILMIKADVFKKNKYPWFKFLYQGESDKFPKGLGEDLYFFDKCSPKMLCDSRIQSLHHGHQWIGPAHYLEHNKIKLDEGNNMIITDEQIEEISKNM